MNKLSYIKLKNEIKKFPSLEIWWEKVILIPSFHRFILETIALVFVGTLCHNSHNNVALFMVCALIFFNLYNHWVEVVYAINIASFIMELENSKNNKVNN